MRKTAIATLLLITIFLFSSCRQTEFDLFIYVHAGSEKEYYYADSEFRSITNSFTVTAGPGTENLRVILKPVGSDSSKTYESQFLAPGTSVKLSAEFCVWYQIGVYAENPTDEEIRYTVHVSNVGDLRIE